MELRYEDENIWLPQRLMAELYGVDISTVNEHIATIYRDGGLEKGATIRNFRIVQQEGNRSVIRDVLHYSLQMIIAVGFKVNNEPAVLLPARQSDTSGRMVAGWCMRPGPPPALCSIGLRGQ
jgi:hypothetical protein